MDEDVDHAFVIYKAVLNLQDRPVSAEARKANRSKVQCRWRMVRGHAGMSPSSQRQNSAATLRGGALRFGRPVGVGSFC